MNTAEAVKVYTIPVRDDGRLYDERPRYYSEEAQHDAGTQLDEIARSYQQDHPDWTYERALDAAMDAEPELKKVYAGVSE